MDRSVLDDLVAIWEKWTDQDPALRHALQRLDSVRVVGRQVHDQVLERLHLLAESHETTEATCAALSAGWAVLLALEGARAEQYRQLCHDAQMAHQEALAQLAQRE